MKLSKAIIKKYGISKKAWAMQRKIKGAKKKAPKVKTKVIRVAKRKNKKSSAGKMTKTQRMGRKIAQALVPFGLGMIQEPVNNWVSKTKLGGFMSGLGNYADEALWWGVGKGLQASGATGYYLPRKISKDLRTTSLNNAGRQAYYDVKDWIGKKGSTSSSSGDGVFV